MNPAAELRRICLAFPEASEKEAWGDPTFRVRDKIFAMFKQGHQHRPQVWLKARDGAQEMLIEAVPDRFFRPPYVGHKGWVGIWLDDGPDWDEVAGHTRQSYLLTAPRKLASQME